MGLLLCLLHLQGGQVISLPKAEKVPVRATALTPSVPKGRQSRGSAMHYILSWEEGSYLDWGYRTAEQSVKGTAQAVQWASRNYSRTVAVLVSAVIATVLHGLAHALFPEHGCHHVVGHVAWLAEPGRPDPVFGPLCLYSNVFFACLAPPLWFRRRLLELAWVGAVGGASTLYHALQIHPSWGPEHAWTRLACLTDICLAVSFGLFLAARYPRTRARALPVLAGALLCFWVPSVLPSEIAEVGYSWLHSAWHGFAALAAFVAAGSMRREQTSSKQATVAQLLLQGSAGRR